MDVFLSEKVEDPEVRSELLNLHFKGVFSLHNPSHVYLAAGEMMIQVKAYKSVYMWKHRN